MNHKKIINIDFIKSLHHLKFILVFSIIAFIITFQFSSTAFADGSAEEETTTTISATTQGHIEVDASLGTQQIFTKKIPIIVSYTPNIEGRRAYLNVITPSGIELSESTVWVPIEKGKKITKKIYISPKKGGTYTLTAEAIVYGYDVNYGDSTTVSFTLNDNLVMKENSSTYYLMTALVYLIILVAVVVIIFFIVKLLPKLITKFKKWLLNDASANSVKNDKEIEEFYKKLNRGEKE
ncbi:MAG TPA: hypothetical protein PLL26_01260 [Candidatus Dojkabacteria bacterium]|nr:hypothetical protein [Candidatus Dojkabacteria bacterium]